TDLENDVVRTQGDAFGAQGFFEDLNRDSTIEIGLDVDTNPYNGTSRTLSTIPTATIERNYFQRVYDTSVMTISSGAYYIYVRIGNGVHSRYYYAQGKLTLNDVPDPGAPKVTITSPTSADTWTISQSTAHLQGTASTTATLVTWTNLTTGRTGTANGTISWNTFGIPLNRGPNLIVVTAIDNKNRPGTDSITITYDDSCRNVTLDAKESIYIVSASPNTRYRDSFLYVGYDPSPSIRNERSLIKFDVSIIPPGSTINTASLQL